jgi:hypothetical protein
MRKEEEEDMRKEEEEDMRKEEEEDMRKEVTLREEPLLDDLEEGQQEDTQRGV